jgi:hypothetical protein
MFIPQISGIPKSSATADDLTFLDKKQTFNQALWSMLSANSMPKKHFFEQRILL